MKVSKPKWLHTVWVQLWILEKSKTTETEVSRVWEVGERSMNTENTDDFYSNKTTLWSSNGSYMSLFNIEYTIPRVKINVTHGL